MKNLQSSFPIIGEKWIGMYQRITMVSAGNTIIVAGNWAFTGRVIIKLRTPLLATPLPRAKLLHSLVLI